MPVVFERIELDYGRHGGVFPLVPHDQGGSTGGTNGSGNGSNGSATKGTGTGRPFVILGPNGAGKSTLIEAPARTLFGFIRNRKEGREAHGQRKPWVGGAYRALVVVRTAAGRFTFERDFETDRIRVTETGRESPLFDAEANPSRTGEAVSQYRQILRDVVGLDNFDHYRDTACVFQGGLLARGLSVELLRVAAGGHTDVESAYARLRKEYTAITVDPIAAGKARRRKPGQLQVLIDRVTELELELAEARATEQRRTPLVRARDERVAGLDVLALEIGRLETAFETLSEGRRLEAEVEAARARIRGLESAEHELDEALAGFSLLIAREQAHGARYPVDFAERARALEEGLWPNLANVEAEADRLRGSDAVSSARPPAVAWQSSPISHGAAGILVLAGLGLAISGSILTGTSILVSGIGAGAFLYTRHRAAQMKTAFRERRLAELATERTELVERVTRLTTEVPDGASLRAETLPSARREFEREEADRRLHSDSEQALRQAMDAAGRAIALHEADRDATDLDAGDAHRDAPGLPARARVVLNSLREASARERDDQMAPLRLRLNDIARARFDLPEDVQPDLEAVRLARRERLARAAAEQAELATIERDLAAEGRVTASVLSLERELGERRSETAAVDARATAYRHAYSFVSDAYEAFRTTDEDRLLGAISAHLESVSGGTMGPIQTTDGLDEATVQADGRSLPLTSPPLSYGQLHAALLSVRMGAADFLAGLGVGLPLLIDDPFVHLDERAITDLWRVLERIAVDRQVVVATQDRLVLEHLGVTPNLELSSAGRPPAETGDPAAGADTAPIDRVSEAAVEPPVADQRDQPRFGEGILDLWDDPAD